MEFNKSGSSAVFLRVLVSIVIGGSASISSAAPSLLDDNPEGELDNSLAAPVLLKTDLNIPLSMDGELLVAVTEYANQVAMESGVGTQTKIAYKMTQPSLRGNHFRFEQKMGETPIYQRQLVISVNTQTRTVFQIYNNLKPDSATKNLAELKHFVMDFQKSARTGRMERMGRAWDAIGATGKLMSAPSEQLVLSDDLATLTGAPSGLRFLSKVSVLTSEPYGDWIVTLDPISGEVVEVEDQIVNLSKQAASKNQNQFVRPRFGFDQALRKLSQFQTAQAQAKAKLNVRESAGSVTGTALVFDPDPVTYLRNPDLLDTSTADLFEAAYRQVDLLDMTRSGDGMYSLVGPWVQLIDFESPVAAPATSMATEWTSKRGSLPFNDTMTYYHLDKSQRYMQSLGFAGETGIQHLSIEVDANGLYGQDNSHFIPSSNRLAFGHGCVDDNEDADVILHEYGHAIQRSIVTDWTSGDTGAMGEGFGDYWAASYSFRTLGPDADGLNKVFNWDGVEGCWNGRVMNATSLMYDHTKTYGAHSPLGGNFSTDELWSAPLFQSLLTLAAMGIDASEVDKIVLESHFGLGARVKMRDLAMATVNSAKLLFPEGPHAGVLLEKFMAQKIIE